MLAPPPDAHAAARDVALGEPAPSLMASLAGLRLLGRSPAMAYLRANRWLWRRLPRALEASSLMRAYSAFLHRLVRLTARRRQYFGTFFFRNRPALSLIRSLAEQRAPGARLTIAFLGCSNGAELYSTLWTIRSSRPDLNVVASAVDISPAILDVARRGVYSLTVPELVDAPIFDRITAGEMQAMFDVDAGGETVSIRSWLRDGVRWYLGDAASQDMRAELGAQDIVVANNFLCHMPPPEAERCLRSIARIPSPAGYLVVAGVDLDVRTKVARDLGLRPVGEAMEEIHDGDPSVRGDWPWHYWALEPFDRRRRDWRLRYASVVQVPDRAGRLEVCP